MNLNAEWLDRFSNLNVAKTASRGKAPHKPLLLLCIIDMVEEGELLTPWVNYSPELFHRFQYFWEIVYERQRNKPEMRLPFHALGGDRDRIWSRYTEDGLISKSRETTELCQLDERLWDCLQDAKFRKAARTRLISGYFTPSEQVSLYTKLHLPIPATEEIAAIKASSELYKKSIAKGRDAGFRSAVILNYKFTCALTGYSLTTTKENIVEAAHIHQHAVSGNNDPRNGLALTPDAHWMFDRGLWTVEVRDDKYIVIVAVGHFKEESFYKRSLLDYHERPLVLHEGIKFRPSFESFQWHRNTRYIGRVNRIT